ncbi:MAG TPA: plasmid stabilization protein [Lentisphaeria bacterium]|nr:MAG: plasmid stabilization protein [Lentisphaerae bacterium GWF2_49_21]HBC85708.1 plasmid stabilization protein [Lentisphaeria bacterium]
MYSLVWTDTFLRTAKRFFKKHPELKPVFEDVARKLQENPQNPSLRFHHLKGIHKGKSSVSLTYSYRIVITIEITAKEIFLLDIGSHDKVYK